MEPLIWVILSTLMDVLPFSWAQYSQTLALPYQTERNCTKSEYFNAITMSCVACPNGTVPTASNFACQCPSDSIITEVTPTGIQCQRCPQGFYPSSNGLECIPCKTSHCCPEGSVYYSHNVDGSPAEPTSSKFEGGNSTIARTDQCVKCVYGTMPNEEGTSCQLCGTLECFCQMNSSLCASPPITELDTTIRLVSGEAVKSSVLEETLETTASRCIAGNEHNCQKLANLCVLQNFDASAGTACAIIEKLRDRRLEGTIPPLFFPGEADTELYRETAITQQFLFDDGDAGRMEILLTRYAFNGTFMGFVEAESVLHPCAPKEARQAFKFGRRYRYICHISLEQLFYKSDLVFFEAFIKFYDEGGSPKMYPVAVLNSLVQSATGIYVNKQDGEMNSWVLTRRFFYSDCVSYASEVPGSIRYAKDIHLHVEMRETRDGSIFPPYLSVVYAETNHNRSNVVDAVLSVTYEIDPSRHDRELEITMAILGPLSVLWAAVKAYSWGRRSGKASLLDTYTVIQFVLFEFSVLGDVFLVVLTAMSCWITFAYKSQRYPFYSMLNEHQEWVIMAYIIATLCLKFIALIHTIIHMVLQETFFIDWERSQIIENTQLSHPASRDVSKDRKELPVVVWRTCLVANEWAELSCVRATCVSLQLCVVLMLLEAFDFMRFSIVQPGFGDGSASAEATKLTRFAVVIFFYLVVGFLQWILGVAFVERVITDPFRNFIDLCSIANISVITLTHPLHGYYIHGRSVHGRADTGMAEMNEFLQKERDDLCGFRGLENGSHLQTFSINLPIAFRSRYDEIMAQIRNVSFQVRMSGSDHTTAKIATTARIHEQMNKFLREVVEHSITDVDYVIRDRSFVEALLEIELTDTSHTGDFLRDSSEVGFSNCFLYGREWSHLSFEAMLFVVAYLFFDSLTLAAAIVFCVSRVISEITSIFFTNNLVRGSLVDHRFLI